jgi:hypothetical protein
MTVIKGVGVPVVDQIGHQAGNTAVLRQVCEKGADVVIGLAGVQNVMSDRKPKTAKLTVPLHDERKKMPKPVLIFHDNENKEIKKQKAKKLSSFRLQQKICAVKESVAA